MYIGSIAEWSNARDCKSRGFAFVGSNPTRPTNKNTQLFAEFFYL